MHQKEIKDYIDTRRQDFINMSLSIWDYAELAFHEYKSSSIQAEMLEKEGFTIEWGLAGLDTAFSASWGNGEPVIGFLGEFDALKNLSQKADCLTREPVTEGAPGHGCGHHVLGTSCVAAAIANKHYLEENNLPGTVVYYGCPAEEGGAGKTIMNCAGVFDKCSACISWHATDDNGIWSINFHAQQSVEFTFSGNAGDTFYLRQNVKVEDGTEANSLEALQLFSTGMHILWHHLDSSVMVRSTVTEVGDDSIFQVPRESKIRFWLRAHTGKEIREVMERMLHVAQGAGYMTGCKVKAEYFNGYSEMLPNRSLERIMYDKYCDVGTVEMTEEDWKYAERMHSALPDNEETTFDLIRFLYEEQAEPIIKEIKGKPYNDLLYPYREINKHKPGSTDICDVSWTTPTTQCVVACYIKDTLGHSWQEVSQGRSDICMKGMLVAAKVMALTAAELFDNPEALKAVRDEFCKEREGKVYIPLKAGVIE